MNISNIFFNLGTRTGDVFAVVAEDVSLFSLITNDLIDFGYEIGFYFFGGAGHYTPHLLATEALSAPEKNQIFSNAFLAQYDSGVYRARFRLSRFLSFDQQVHYFLHELTHFYQDMHGFYYVPLREEGVFPVMLDARSRVVLTLFNECWAACESIRAGWRLKQKGQETAWRGALASKDWGDLAGGYSKNLSFGMEEMQAALRMQEQWYNAPQREFYEREALAFFSQNIAQYSQQGQSIELEKFRKVRIEDLIARMPEEGALSYFKGMEAQNPLFTDIKMPIVRKAVESFEAKHGQAENTNIQDIRCGSPPYLWKRILDNEKENSEISEAVLAQMQGQGISFS